MNGLVELEDQINSLTALNRSSTKALESFADTSHSIAIRSRQITRDVKPWEVAQENIALTIEEMAKAARCYHPPPSLNAVLSGKEKSPEAISRCVDYLVYADDYLASHPPNEYGDEIAIKSSDQLRAVVSISEGIVKASFISALDRPTQPPASSSASALSPPMAPGKIIRNPAALQGVDHIIQRLGENFNQLEVIQTDVYQLLERRLKATVQSEMNSGAYRDDQPSKSPWLTGSKMTIALKHYQYGEHALLSISKASRGYVAEVAECLEKTVLIPLSEDYAVAEMPSTLALLVFEMIETKIGESVSLEPELFADATKLFVESRGQGIGLYAVRNRYLRDVILVGLNLMQEMWSWKEFVATSVPGENNNLIDHVDERVERYAVTVRDALEGYINCVGGLDAAALKAMAMERHNAEWFPATDCTAHESTTNLLYLHKALLSSYFGAVKLVLHGDSLDPNADDEAVREVEDIIVRSVLGHVQDLHTIVDCAMELQEEASKHRHSMRGASVFLPHSGDRVRFSPEIFLLNNVCFLLDNYKKESCFSLRRLPLELDETSKKKQGALVKSPKGAVGPSIVAYASATLEDEKERSIIDFGYSWELCFPKLFENEEIHSIEREESVPLRKSQRMAMKKWFKEVSDRLSDKMRDCRSHSIMDSGVRARLVEVSVQAIQDQFKMAEDILLGRQWSSRPQKWIPFSTQEWVDQVKKLF